MLLLNMIKSFKSKEAEKLFKREFSKKIAHNIQRTAMKKLSHPNAASVIASQLVELAGEQPL